MDPAPTPHEPRDPFRERDFYRRLLELNSHADIERLLDEALALIVEITGASTAYIELYDDADGSAPRFWRGYHCSEQDLSTIRTSISRGIIAKAITEGKRVTTKAAQTDPRFEDLRSVQLNAIGAVLCVPIGTPPMGVVYLQDRKRPGEFGPEDMDYAEIFARQLAPLADRFLSRRPERELVDHTKDVRERFRAPHLIGRSKALAKMLKSASLVAPLDVDVLVTGPSGTGKSAIVQAIVENGPRAGRPFIALNCAAIPETLVESELFGAEKGSHSQATKKMMGKVAAAEGGTLFLDEIGELPAGAQAKFLLFLQDRVYHPLGATEQAHADVRIIAATNANLRAEVTKRRFREDLYYRLHVLPLELPGLGERRDDIPELVEHFVVEACKRHKMKPLAIARKTMFACREAPWPGHVRQLENFIQAAVIRAHGAGSSTLQVPHVFPDTASHDDKADAAVTFHEATRAFQQRLVREALERNSWNATDAARELDLARSYVYNLIQVFGLERATGDGAGGKR
ncbi:MAG TPA: sigma 54-interacting transcriptional regulator [Kofleriaceae bacterium]